MAAGALLGGQFAAARGIRWTSIAGLILVIAGYICIWFSAFRSEAYLWIWLGLWREADLALSSLLSPERQLSMKRRTTIVV